MVVGDPGVGKSCLSIRASSDHFVGETDPTIDDVYVKRMLIGEQTVVIEFFDAGFSNRPVIYRDSPLILLVYSIAQRTSFEILEEHYHKLQVMRDSVTPAPVVVVANKSDLESDRVVSKEEGKAYAVGVDALFIETSAKTGSNIGELCTLAAERIIEASTRTPPKKLRKESRCIIL